MENIDTEVHQALIKEVALILARGENSYLGDAGVSLFHDHWEHFISYRNKSSNTEVSGYASQSRWYLTAEKLLNFLDSRLGGEVTIEQEAQNVDFQTQLTEVHDRVDQVDTEIVDVNSAIAEIHTELEGHGEDICYFEKRISDLEKEREDFSQEDLDEEAARVAETENFVAEFEQSLDDVRDNIAAITHGIKKARDVRNASPEQVAKHVLVTIPETLELIVELLERFVFE
jgi:DNA repair ATPase RecN